MNILRAKVLLVSLALLFSASARGEFIPIISPTHWYWVGNYGTRAALYAECVSLLTRLQQSVERWCGSQAGAEPIDSSWTTIWGGYIQDLSLPPGQRNDFYYLDAYACKNNDNVRYFEDTKKCYSITRIPAPPASPKNHGPSCPANPQNRQPSCGNPIAVGTGNKVQSEVDYKGSMAGALLSLSRTYNSTPYPINGSLGGAFGNRWSQLLDRRLQRQPVATELRCFVRNDTNMRFCEYSHIASAGQAVSVLRPDGKIHTFRQSGSDWIGDLDVDARISAQYAADGVTVTGWIYATSEQEAEHYSEDGRLLSVTSRSGAYQSYTYSTGVGNDTATERWPADSPVCPNAQGGAALPAGLLVCVTDNWGRQLQFEYDAKSRVVKALDPANQEYLYAYDGPSAGCLASAPASLACAANNLTKVTYPGGKTRTYHYNESSRINIGAGACSNVTASGNGYGHLLNALTGITDENGVRYASWGYDCVGRANLSEHAGGVDKVAVSYGTLGSDGAQTNSVTSHIGTTAAPATVVRNYHSKVILGVSKNDTLDKYCAGCGGMRERSYDVNGNVLTSKDWNGSVTSYTYELARNLETSRTEAVGTAQARTTTTTWHPSLRLPVKIAAPLRLTTYSYDSAGNLTAKSVQATTDTTGVQGVAATVAGLTRNWSYTYNEFGQLLNSTGPRNDITTYAYDSAGNLSSVTNSAGHVTTLSNYDAHGRAGRVTDPNGLVTDFSYTQRGWLSSVSVSGQNTDYDYDGVGQLTQVGLPDGSSLNYTYDSAHRLTGISDSAGNSIVYTLDKVGNRVDEQVRDANGTLARQISRVYDPLNLLKQITGALQ